MRESYFNGALAGMALLAMVSVSHAQATSDRDAALSAFAKDLAHLQEQVPTSSQEYMAMNGDMIVDWWDRLIKKAQEMRQRWNDNPFVRVTGFSLSLSVPPSIDVEFEFK